MTHVRIVLAALPPLLDGIVREALLERPDVHVTSVTTRRTELAHRLRRLSTNVVVLTASESEAAIAADELRHACAGLRVLAIAPAGESAWLFDQLGAMLMLRDVSPATLAAAIATQ